MRRKQGNLGGLVRLRSVRERDSRIGLATALQEERAAAAELADLHQLLESLPMPLCSDLAAFHGRQHSIDLVRDALTRTRATLESARHLTAAARERWVSDRSRLAAVESLVERRVVAARIERQRRETRELDEVAEQMWRRRTLLAVAGGGAR